MSCQTARLGTHLLVRGGGEKLSGGCCAHAGEPGPQKELGWGRASPPSMSCCLASREASFVSENKNL